MIKNTLLLLILFFLTLNVSSQENDYNFLTIPAELKENANAVERLDKMTVDIISQREMVVSVDGIVTVLNKLADDYADVTIFYDKTRKIQKVTAIYYDAFGNEIKKVRKKDFKDYSASGSNLFSDSRVIHFDYTPITYPYTVHYQYQYKSSNTAFIPRWIYVSSYYKSIQNSIYTINYPEGFVLKKSEMNFDGFDIEVKEEKGSISYLTKDIKAIKKEPLAPYIFDFVPTVKFGLNKFNLEGVDGEANNWDEFGKWYYDNLIYSTLDLPESTKSKIKSLTKSTNNPVEKAKIVYKYVQDKVRYISIQVGVGGYKPMQASEVDKLSYGDCKALTNYTSALLKEVGLESYHTLLHADIKRDINSEVAAPEGNHMILYLPIAGKDYWLECTSQNSSFGDIGDFTDDRDVLIITSDGGKIKHTRIYDEKENLQKITGNYSIDNDGHIIAQVDVKMMGTQFDNHIHYEQATPKEKEELFKNFWDNINNMNIESAEIINNKKDGKFEEKVSFNAANYASKTGDRLIFPINAFNVSGKAPKRIRDRKLPVDISFGYYDVDEVTVNLPENYSIEAISNNVLLETTFGSYKLIIDKISEHQLSYKREVLIKNGQYPKEAYKEYRSFIKKIAKADRSKIVLIKK